MLMYPDLFEDWLDFGHRLLIFPILAALWLGETNQILGFPGLSLERMGGMA